MKNKQGITIAALIIAIVGLSIGFAAFSNTLNISSTASVNPDASNLKVVFANNTDVNNLNTNPVQVFSASTGASGTPGTINNEAQNGPALTGLKASFTQPGQSVVYKLNVVNAGKLKAYLTDIVFGTTGNPAKTVLCTVATKDSNNQDIPVANQATDTLVQSACNGISISVKIGELDAKTASGSLNNLELNVAGYKEVIITISYASGSAYVDGPMNVAFGDIEINAASVGAQSQGGSEPTPVTPQFVVTGDGEIIGYTGNQTVLSIPSTLPETIFTLTSFDLQGCTDMIGAESCEGIYETLSSGEEGLEEYISMANDSTIGQFISYTLTLGSNVSVTKIGDDVFKNKGLTKVTIPSNVVRVGDEAFYSNLFTKVIIDASASDEIQFKDSNNTFTFDPSANCTLSDNSDWKTNSCICWLQDDPTCGD